MFSSLIRSVTRNSSRYRSNNVNCIQCHMYRTKSDMNGAFNRNVNTVEGGHGSPNKIHQIIRTDYDLSNVIKLDPTKVVEVKSHKRFKNDGEENRSTHKAYGEIKKNSYNEILEKSERILTKMMSDLNSEGKCQVAIETKRIIADMLSFGEKPSAIFYSRASSLNGLNLPENTKKHYTSFDILKAWSKSKHPQGVLAIFPAPKSHLRPISKDSLPIQIVCQGIKNPGVMGATLRVAASIGCREVLLTKDCINIWSSKTIKAGAGAQFRLRIKQDMTWEDIAADIKEDTEIYLVENYVPLEEPESDKNELNDVEKTSKKVMKPTHKEDMTFQKITEERDSIPLTAYYSPNYKTNVTNIIVIGGETQGLCLAAYQLAKKHGGVRVHVPISNVDFGLVLPLVAYEMKKRFEMSSNEQQQQQQQEQNTPEEVYRGVGLYSE